VTYSVSRLTHFDGIIKYTIIAILSYILASKLGAYVSFTLPITEVLGTILNPLLWLTPVIKKMTDEIMPSIVDEIHMDD
jgi:hypothetical protein